MKREYSDYLKDIVENIEKIDGFVKDMHLEDFEKDTKTVFAVIRALEVIGEAAKKLPAIVKNRYKEVPWKEISGMRDKLIHEYFGVDTKVVWRTIKQDLPVLNTLIRHILESE